MPLGLGATNPVPFILGGGESTVEQETHAILMSMEPALDPDMGTANYAEAYGEAMAVSIIRAVNNRLENQSVPETMMENLTVWEEACAMHPTESDFDIDRRARLSAKLGASAGNAIGDITTACAKILGANFVAIHITAPVDWIVYWPGVNPGPPGLEWSSNRARISVQSNSDGITQKQFDDKRSALVNQLDAMLPAWMNFQIGVGTAFIANVGLVGKTLV